MDKFLEVYNLPLLIHEETEKLNRPITSEESKFLKVKNKILPTKRSPRADGFTEKFQQTLKEE